MQPGRWALLAGAAAAGAGGQSVAAWGTSGASFLAALALFALGGWCLRRAEDGEPTAVAIEPSSLLSSTGLALLGAALLLAAAAASYAREPLSLLQIAAWLGAILVLVAGAAVADRARPRAPFASGWSGSEIVVLLAVTALAFALRLWRLEHIPPAVWDDEILYVHDAVVTFAEVGTLSPFASGAWGAPYLHAYTIAAAAALVGDRVVALRLVAVIPAALTVPLLYLALRELFTRNFAFFAAALLALAAWALILARHGYVWAINGFIAALVLWALARGLRRGGLVDFALAGVALGLGIIYSYSAALMPAVVLLYAVVLLASRPALLGARTAGLALLVFAAAVTAAPRLTALTANPHMRGYQERALVRGNEEATAFEVFALQLEQIGTSFNRMADRNPLFVPEPQGPLLDPITAAAFGLGFFWALFSWRRAGATLLLLTFAVMLLPSAAGLSSTDWATAWRACGVLPAVFGLAGAPFAIAVAAARPRVARAVVGSIVLALFGLIALINLHGYFVRHPSKAGWWDGSTPQRMRVSERLLAAPPDEKLWLNWDLDSDHLRALVRGKRPYELFTWPDDVALPALLDATASTTVVAGTKLYWEDDLAAGAVLMDLLRHYYPGGRFDEEHGPRTGPMFAAYTLTPDEIRAAHGLTTRELEGGALELSGSIIAPRDGVYALAAANAPEARCWIDGEGFAYGLLAAGLHQLRVSSSSHEPILLWSIDEAPLAAVPHANLLQRGLPPWGLLERGSATAAHAAWQRWVPLPWYAAPERAFGELGDSVVEWSGEVELAAGDYTFLLRNGASTSIWFDGSPLVFDAVAWPEWMRIPVRVAAGWHRLVIRSLPPSERRELQLFWIDAGGRPGLFGGPASRYP